MSVLRVFQRNEIYEKYKTNKKKTHDKVYQKQKMIGEKWQVDVKFVSKECKAENLADEKFYQ